MLFHIIEEFSLYFIALILEASGFVLLGSIIGSIIEEFLPEDTIPRLVRGKTFGAILIAGLVGLVLPICECAIVPVAKKLIKKGTPPPAAITLMLAVPIMNPIVGFSTYVAFSSDISFALTRMLSGYVLSVIIGTLFLLPFRNNAAALLLPDEPSPASCGCGQAHGHGSPVSLKERLGHMAAHTWMEFSGAAGYLFLGAGIAAFVHSAVPMKLFDLFNRFPGGDRLVMMAAAFTLNLCSEADAFVGRSFSFLFSPSAIMAFLVLGPMLDIKLLAMYRTIFKPRMILRLGLTIFAAVFIWITGLEALGLLEGQSL